MKQVNAVAGFILNKNGEILCTQRSASKYDYISFKWEFPGGKSEEGESETQTLERELMEELEIKVNVMEKFFDVEHEYPDFKLNMPVYKCVLETENLQLVVHESIKWLKPSEIMELDWAGADVPVAQKIFDTMAN